MIRTDYEAVIYLLKNLNTKHRLFRGALFLQGYNFEIDHIKGDANFSDLLSKTFDCTEINVVRGYQKLKMSRREEIKQILMNTHLTTEY